MSFIEVGELEVREPQPGWRGLLPLRPHDPRVLRARGGFRGAPPPPSPGGGVHVVEGELELPGDREQPGRRRMAASGGFTAAARTRRCDGGGRCCSGGGRRWLPAGCR